MFALRVIFTRYGPDCDAQIVNLSIFKAITDFFAVLLLNPYTFFRLQSVSRSVLKWFFVFSIRRQVDEAHSA